jgi:hypothetical protein
MTKYASKVHAPVIYILYTFAGRTVICALPKQKNIAIMALVHPLNHSGHPPSTVSIACRGWIHPLVGTHSNSSANRDTPATCWMTNTEAEGILL